MVENGILGPGYPPFCLAHIPFNFVSLIGKISGVSGTVRPLRASYPMAEKKIVLVLGKESTIMKVATVTVPSNWEPFKSEVKACLEFYTSIAATPFQVNVNADGNEGGMEIADFENPDDKEQNWILECAVNDFNLRTQRNPSQDLGTVVFDFRNELNQQRRVKADNFRKWLLRRIMKRSVS